MEEKIKNVKIAIVGSAGVGKTLIVERLFNKDKATNPPTTQLASRIFRIYKYEQEKLNFEVWDTYGDEQDYETNKIYYKDADIVVIVYDITNKCDLEDRRNVSNKKVQNFEMDNG